MATGAVALILKVARTSAHDWEKKRKGYQRPSHRRARFAPATGQRGPTYMVITPATVGRNGLDHEGHA